MPKQAGKLASRYAKALLGVVKQQGGEELIRAASDQIQSLGAAWENEPELSSTLLSPMLDRAARRRALSQILEVHGVCASVKRLVELLFDRERLAFLPQIGKAYARLADEALGVVAVKVLTARDLEDAEKEEIAAGLRAKLDGSPNFHWEIRPELLGGIVVEFGGKVLDASLSGKLGRFERQLLA